jgi:hypothetical protein
VCFTNRELEPDGNDHLMNFFYYDRKKSRFKKEPKGRFDAVPEAGRYLKQTGQRDVRPAPCESS